MVMFSLYRFIGLLCFIIFVQGDLLAEQRRRELFNREWKYSRGDFNDAYRIDFDDTGWSVIGLPHSFSIPYFMSKDFYIGYGWYRKTLDVSADESRKLMFLEFDGVFQEAEVFVNGQKAGSHVGGYTGFSIDISPYIRRGNNVLAVRVNNLWKPDVAPRAGEHVFSGGIYRNVRLVYKEPVYIEWCGVGIQTPDLGLNQGKSSRVSVETEVVNSTDKAEACRLHTLLLSPKGRIIERMVADTVLPARSTVLLRQSSNPVQNPQLWSPEHPVQYQIVSRLYKKRYLLDETSDLFGFRWFEWTADKGFFLNGRHYYFRGVNVHQDQAGWGDAVTESAMHRDVCQMKGAGFNLIRGSHYPHAPAFVEACDKEGMLFWSEATFWGIGGFKSDGYWDSSAYPVSASDTAAFEESALQQLSEMIRIHRNSPSVVVWSLCNEPFFSEMSVQPGVRHLLKRMTDLAHRSDPSRPVAIGGAQRPLGVGRIDKLADIAGYNGDGATQSDFQQPGIPSVVSEYGSITSDRPGDYAPGWGDLQHNDAWKGVGWRCGQAIWCGFDHGSIAGSALGKMGIVDYFRIPKRAWYWYRNYYRQIPPPAWPVDGKPTRILLESEGNRSILTDGTDDVFLKVTMVNNSGQPVSNSPVVTLSVLSGPGEFPTGKSIRFAPDSDIRIQDGQAAVSFRSYYAGTTVIEASSPGLPPERITLHFIGTTDYDPTRSIETDYRPYSAFIREKGQQVVQIFGRSNPTFASSSAAHHSAGLATDQQPNTYWKADLDDTSPWLMVDTEKKLNLHTIRVALPDSLCHSCTVQVSEDRHSWQTLTKWKGQAHSMRPIWKRTDLKSIIKARFVRFCFTSSQTAAISEILIDGIVLQ